MCNSDVLFVNNWFELFWLGPIKSKSRVITGSLYWDDGLESVGDNSNVFDVVILLQVRTNNIKQHI